jgi:hypothetical protein
MLLQAGLAALMASSATLALFQTPAGAFLGYGNRTAVFGEAGSGDGQFSLTPSTNAPGAGVAVDDSTHDVYVTDTHNNRIEKFTAAGVFIAAWGWGVSDGNEEFEVCTSGCREGSAGAGEGQFSAPVSVAVDNSPESSAGDVYVADRGNRRIVKLSSSGTPLGQFGAVGDPGSATDPAEGLGELKGGNSVFVDPVGGNVWVADAGNKRAVEFSASGEYIAQIGGFSENAFGLTVDAGGNVYVVNGALRVEEFGPGPAFAPIRRLENQGANHARAVVTNPAGEVFVGNGGEGVPYQILQFDPGAGAVLPTRTFGLESIGGSTGIAIDSTNRTFFAADGPNSDVDVFDLVKLAGVITGPSSNPKGTTVTVEGTIDPEGVEAQYFFEYGTDESYGLKSTEEISSAATSQPVTANLTGLTPETTYHYRLVAFNVNGTSQGLDAEFKTGPAVAEVLTLPPTEVGITTARLNGQLNPEGVETFYIFQYGLTSGYGAIGGFEASSANTLILASTLITELTPGTEYHYQIFAFSEHGETSGGDQAFTTLPAVVTVNDQSPFATGISLHEATLHGTVNPGNGITTYRFEYGTSTAYGASTPEAYTQLNYEDDPGEQLITGLQAGTTYHYRVVASNASGTITGPDETFTTLSGIQPTVETGGASQISPNSATIAGIVDPAGESASYEFEVGTSSSYGTQLFGAISSREEVTAGLTGLLPETVYHYRLVASDAAGIIHGADRTFTTSGFPVTIVQPGTPALLPIPVFPPEKPKPPVKCKKGFVKKGGKCVKKHHKSARKKHKKK